jgi:HMGL-like
MSPLRARMIEDMKLAGLAATTQGIYLQAVRSLAKHYNRSPELLAGAEINYFSLADTMGWATPLRIERVLGEVRSRWPDMPIALHLHDTRGLAVANAHAGLQMGVTQFDSTVGGLGGCRSPVSRKPPATSAPRIGPALRGDRDRHRGGPRRADRGRPHGRGRRRPPTAGRINPCRQPRRVPPQSRRLISDHLIFGEHRELVSGKTEFSAEDFDVVLADQRRPA